MTTISPVQRNGLGRGFMLPEAVGALSCMCLQAADSRVAPEIFPGLIRRVWFETKC